MGNTKSWQGAVVLNCPLCAGEGVARSSGGNGIPLPRLTTLVFMPYLALCPSLAVLLLGSEAAFFGATGGLGGTADCRGRNCGKDETLQLLQAILHVHRLSTMSLRTDQEVAVTGDVSSTEVQKAMEHLRR